MRTSLRPGPSPTIRVYASLSSAGLSSAGRLPAGRLLAGAVLARAVLARAVLARVVLARVVLAHAVLAHVVLARVVLTRVVLARVVLAGVVLAGLVLAGPPARACVVTQDGHAALSDAGRLRAVPVLVDGRPSRFLLDTGSEKTVVTPAGKAALRLPADEWSSTGMQGVGGTEWHPDATVGTLVVGGVALRRRIGPIRSIPVLLTNPAATAKNGLDGLLGADLLGGHDIELIGNAHLLILHGVEGCAGAFLPWATVTVPAEYPRAFLPVIPVTVGGVTLRALIDTGAEASLITTRAAAGLRAVAPPVTAAGSGTSSGTGGGSGVGTISGIGPATVAVQARGFGPLSVGRLPLGDGPLLVTPLPATGFDVVLGMDRLRDLHVWLSFATHQVMLAPDPGFR